jgi:carboxyl-terminal processing protease
MQIGNVVKRLRQQRALWWAGLGAGIIIVFGLGVAVGDGRLRLTRGGGYKDMTGLPAGLDYSSVNRVYDTLRQNYNGTLTSAQLIDGLKHGLAAATKDPYTQYFTAQEANAFNGELQGISLTGVGAELDSDADGNVVVMAPLNGSPAIQAGLQAKDVIVTINGASTSGMSLGDAVNKIRGPKGSKVTLGVQRGDQQLTFTITRDTITVPTATTKVLDDGIGYIQVSQFSDDTYRLVQNGVSDFQKQGVKKVILDLRDDPGGEVDTAQDISSLWLKGDALIMQEKRGGQVVQNYRASGVNPLKGMPTVVLVNAGSASASEITALALRDNKAAIIIGEKSYGKGVVQKVIPFKEDGSELKVTIAKWYSPNDTSINKKGITPDQTVTESVSDAQAGTDDQLNAAKTYLEAK